MDKAIALVRSWDRKSYPLKHILIMIVFLVVIYIGIGGVDFGDHQDEKNTTGLVNRYVRTGNLLPGWYAYPSLTTYLSVFAVVPYSVPFVSKYGFESKPLKNHLLNNVLKGNPSFPLNIRKVFVLTASAAVFAVYFTSLAWGRSWIEALVAASLLGFSWEVGYHSRWIAPDAILMLFGGLSILLTMKGVASTSGRLKWLLLGAAAAGFAASTKYPGGLLIVPVFAAVLLFHEKGSGARALIWNMILIGVVFTAAYLLMTPGTILEFDIFRRNVIGEIQHYARGHGPHTVSPGWEHFTLIMTYLSWVLFSHYQPLAVFFFLVSIIGVFAVIKESTRSALVFISFPLLYIFYFSSQSVMFVRNLLVLVPFLAVLSARGLGVIYRWLSKPKYTIPFGLLIVGMLGINVYWAINAMRSIQLIGSDADVQALVAEIQATPEVLYFVSDEIWRTSDSFVHFGNVVQEGSPDVDRAAFYTHEMERSGVWPVNRPGSAPRSFGPYDVNLDYYSDWRGASRVLVTTPDRASVLGIPIQP